MASLTLKPGVYKCGNYYFEVYEIDNGIGISVKRRPRMDWEFTLRAHFDVESNTVEWTPAEI